MGPSSDFRQQRLPLMGRAVEAQRASFRAMVARFREQDARARCIDEVCDQYREGGSEIQLITPRLPPHNLTLVVNGKVAGVFIETGDGIRFEQARE